VRGDVTVNYYPPEWPRLLTTDIEPVSGDLEKNVCRRDFYLFNSSTEKNAVVARTSQRKYSTGDGASLESTQIQGPLEITQTPVFDPTLTRLPVMERFKTWGYKIQRNSDSGDPNVGGLEFLGNQKPPFFEGNYSFFRFNGGVYPTDDNQYELGGAGRRWSLLRAVTVTQGDLILSDKVSGKELYKIHEDENFIYFNDIATGRVLMKLGTDGNLYVTGRVIQGAAPKPAKTKRPRSRAKRK
jgi:hypothetical protein